MRRSQRAHRPRMHGLPGVWRLAQSPPSPQGSVSRGPQARGAASNSGWQTLDDPRMKRGTLRCRRATASRRKAVAEGGGRPATTGGSSILGNHSAGSASEVGEAAAAASGTAPLARQGSSLACSRGLSAGLRDTMHASVPESAPFGPLVPLTGATRVRWEGLLIPEPLQGTIPIPDLPNGLGAIKVDSGPRSVVTGALLWIRGLPAHPQRSRGCAVAPTCSTCPPAPSMLVSFSMRDRRPPGVTRCTPASAFESACSNAIRRRPGA